MASPDALIVSGSTTVLINGLPAATLLSNVSPHVRFKRVHVPVVCKGSSRTMINNLPAARFADLVSCGGLICAGSSNVLIDGLPAARFSDPIICF